MRYRLVKERETSTCVVYVDQDGRIPGKIFLPRADFPDGIPPLLWLTAETRER